MLITERSIPRARTAPAIQPRQSRTAPTPQVKALVARTSSLLSKAGDRQSWLLFALVLIPVIGMIRNFLAFGFER
ncbi:MAG: hypothetical protein HC933_13135 [Pleurocapsa sp. SU_196_0]|nr:hypothetical protein [Pleurocapsa sp. SU_196_0]